MGFTIYEEIFGMAVFPIFATDTNGKLQYKNKACRQYLPMLRKSASVLRHLTLDSLPSDSFLTKIRGGSPYGNVIALYDGNHYLFLAFPRLQYPDAEKVSEAFFSVFGKTPDGFLYSCKKHSAVEASRPAESRIAAELLGLFGTENAFTEKRMYSASSILEVFSEKVAKSFPALGYRVRTEIGDFCSRHPVCVNLFDLLFLFGRVFYLMTKLTADGSVLLSAKSRDGKHHLTFSCKTKEHVGEDDIFALFDVHAPECHADLLFLKSTDALPETAVQTEEDALHVTVSVPYTEAQTAISLHSAAADREIMLLCAYLFPYIKKQIKETLSVS